MNKTFNQLTFSSHSYGSITNQYTHWTIDEYEFPQQPGFLRIKMKALERFQYENDLLRPTYKQVKEQCYKKWDIPETFTVEGSPINEKEMEKIRLRWNSTIKEKT